jgi:DNA-directed RNA polymerase subunit RPC12/RpoP
MSGRTADAGEIGGDDEVVGGPAEELPPLPEDAEAATKAAGRDFPCARCGAALQFSPGEQKLRCPFCAHEQDVALDAEAKVAENDLSEMLERIAARRRGEKPAAEGVHEVRCDACGANVQFRGALTATKCPYCAAPIHREGVHDAPERVPVDGVLPFQVGEPAAKENLRAWIRSRWFLPNDLKRDGIQAGFTGVYLPFFTFDALTNNRTRDSAASATRGSRARARAAAWSSTTPGIRSPAASSASSTTCSRTPAAGCPTTR